MCRLAAYIGAPRPLADIVVTPRHSLLVQSQDAVEAKFAVNGDGFGFAWYNDSPEPGLYKDVLSAWSDANLLSLCTHMAAPTFLAHVRASTGAEVARANCHPFTWRNWSFMHNGQIGHFADMRRRLEVGLSDELFALRRGQTDSELLFLLLLQAGLAETPQDARMKVTAQIAEIAHEMGHKPQSRLTCVFSDGAAIYAFRYADDGRCPTLYLARDAHGSIFASEPMDESFGTWSEIPSDTLVSVSPNGIATSTPLTGLASIARVA